MVRTVSIQLGLQDTLMATMPDVLPYVRDFHASTASNETLGSSFCSFRLDTDFALAEVANVRTK